jgi:hypothetical protein
MLPPLNLHLDLLRIDWPLLLSGSALGLTLLGGMAMGLQLRRTRRRVLGTLERVFEQLDLMRLDAQPLDEPVLAPVRAQAAVPAGTHARATHAMAARSTALAAPLAQARRPLAPAELVDYQSAARLAANGAPLAEIADRCGVVAGEARVLLALQQRLAGARRGSAT